MEKSEKILKLPQDKKAKLIIALGLLGMALIFLSWMSEALQAGKTEQPNPTAQLWATQTQKQLKEILGSISGVGKVNVMLTLEGGVEYVYAQDEKLSQDENSSYQQGTPEKLQKKEENERKHILVDSGAKRQALVVRELEPIVKGVVVVCTGGENPVVRARVTEAVKTALGIGAYQVCVIAAA